MPAAKVATPSRGDVSNLAVAAGFGAAAVAVGAYFMVPRTKKNKKRALQREESSIWTQTHVTWPQSLQDELWFPTPFEWCYFSWGDGFTNPVANP